MFCPTCQGTITGRTSHDDEDTGNELIDYTCENGHTWTAVSNLQIIRSIGWGYLWKSKRDQWRGIEHHQEPLPEGGS